MSGNDHRPDHELTRLAVALGGYKLCFVLLVLLIPVLFPGLFDVDAWFGNFHWPQERNPDFFSTLETWDSQHYLYLADEGYSRRRMPIVFFPLYPWLIRAVAWLPGVSPLAAAVLLSNACSLAAVVLLFALVRRRHPGTEWPTLLLMLSFPGALFYQLAYTESLFLLLAVLAFWGLELDRYDLVTGATFFLAMTRPNGFLFGAVIAWDLYSRWREKRGLGAIHFGALAARALGFGFYLLTLQLVTGDAMAGFEMQRAFAFNRSIANIVNVPLFFRNLVDVQVIHGIAFSLLDRLAFLLVAATLIPLWRLDRSMFWFALPAALIGPLSGSFNSFVRYAAVLFPCFVVLGGVLSTESRRPWLWAGSGVFLLLQAVLLVRHVTFHWAG